MDGSVLIIVAACGLSLVCVGVLVIIFMTIGRMGGGVMGFLSIFGRGADKDEDDPAYVLRPRPNLRRIVNTQDFDTAIAKNIVQNENGSPFSTPPSVPSVTPRSRLDAARRSTLRRTPNRRPSDNYSDDEIFGGILDDDGDGSVDDEI